VTDTIPIERFADWSRGLEQAVNHPAVQPALKEIAQQLAGDLGRGFISSESPDGEPWADLKHPRPRGHNTGTRPLIDFGDLMLSVIDESSDHIEIITDDSLTYGTSDPKAHFHQDGTSKMVARPFMGFTQDRITQAARTVMQQVMQNIGAAA
jgi:phage gpG-like protein